MHRRIQLSIFLAIQFYISISLAEWYPASSYYPQSFNLDEHRQITMVDDYQCIITLQIPGLEIMSTDDGLFAGFLGEHSLEDPEISGFVNMPPQADILIEIEEVEYKSYNIDDKITNYYHPDISSDGYQYISGFICVGNPGIIRDLRISPINIIPYRYNETENEIIITSSITFRVIFEGINSINMKSHFGSKSSAFSHLYRERIWNYADDETDDFIPANYIIISPDGFIDEIQPLVEWKNQKGVNTTLVAFSDINANSDNPSIIKSFLETAYYNWDNPPDYVLLVGDETEFPIKKFYTSDPPTPFSWYSFPGYYTDENYFACLEGDDYYPDVFLGRFCAGNSSTVMELANKIINYEKNPNTMQTDWYDQAIMCADQTEPTQRTTKLFIRDIMFADGGFSHIDTLFQGGQTSQLISWINAGRSFINYRGSGWSSGWAGVNLYVGDVLDLMNVYKLPVVTGIGCGVAKFDDGSICFGEAWMVSGSVANPAGSIAFIGPTYNTHTQYNNYLDRGIYEALWEDSLRTIGSALVAGKMSVEEHYAPYIAVNPNVEEIVRVLFGQYILMSDPELLTRASVPIDIVVAHPDSVVLGESTISVNITDNSGNPLENLQVCAYIAGETFAVDLTDETGNVALYINPQSLPNQLHITVFGLDINTYTASIPVYADGQFVSHIGCEFIEEPPGDTLIAPGETIRLSEHAKNFGDEDANDVWASLSCSAAGVIISNDSVYFGDIPVGVDLWSVNDFLFTIPEEFSNQFLTLTATYHDDQGNAWNSSFTVEVHRPNIIFQNHTVDPGPDGLFERGGDAEVVVTIQNIGDLPAYNLTGTLTSTDPEIIIIEGEISFPDLASGQTFNNNASPFVFRVSETCPMGLTAHFNIEVAGDQGGFYYSADYEFEVLVGEPTAVDPSQDEQGIYYAYESRDSLYIQAPEYQWQEISPVVGGLGTEIILDPQTQVEIVELPFEFIYYSQSFDRITIAADGFIIPDSIDISSPPGMGIPFVDYYPGIIAPLWFDMYCQVFEPGDLSYFYDQVEEKFIIEYHNWAHSNSNVILENFQIILFNPQVHTTPSGDTRIMFVYGDVNQSALNGSICGIESPDQIDGITMWDRLEYPNTSFAPEPFTAILFTSEPPEIVNVDNQYAQKYIPNKLYLYKNYPNPFNPITKIDFALPKEQDIRLEVYNILGEKVKELYKGRLDAGYHSVCWDASINSSGVYIILLQAGEHSRATKCILLK